MAVLRDQALPCEIWVTSVDLVSEVNWLLDAQWVWENWVLLVETLHVWNQGQISNWLFCTICVYYEGQGSVIILCGAEHSEPLPSSLHCQNNWQNKVLIKWVVTYPGPNTQMLCVLGQVICSFLTWTWGPSYMSFLERITVHEHKEFTHLWSMVSIFHQNVLLQKTCIPIFLHPSKKTYMSNHDHFCYEFHQNTDTDKWASALQRQVQGEQEISDVSHSGNIASIFHYSSAHDVSKVNTLVAFFHVFL